jgi:TolB-like protein
MSPEQAAAGRLDARSDIYALGCVAYEMLAGTPPFSGPTAQAILARHAVDAVPSLRTVRATVPLAVERAVERALAKVPADRFTTAIEFADAVVAEEVEPPRPRWHPRARTRTLVLGMLGVLALVSAGAWAWRRASAPAVIPSAANIAVLPLASAGADTSLTRLGRDLAVTIGASLDGVGGIKTADRLSIATATANRPSLSAGEGAALAWRLGARSLVRGTLVRAGDKVRIDLGLYSTEGLAPLAEGITATGNRDSIGPLTDSVTWALLKQVWQRGKPPSPSLDAVTTRSVPALRAFLQGEREIGIGHWNEAQLAYRSAIAADSGFWVAHFRYALTRWWTRDPVEEPVLEVLRRNRDRLPERERLLVDAFLTIDRTPRLRIERFALVTQRFPDYWPGWWLYADALHHQGPAAGYDWSEGLEAFHRVVALNPGLVDAWTHIFDLAAGRNHVETAAAYAKLIDLGQIDSAPPGARLISRIQAALDGSGGRLTPDVGLLIDSLAEFMPALPEPGLTLEQLLEFQPVFLTERGLPAAQQALNQRAIATGKLTPPAARAFRAGEATAWGARGRWDSALTILSALATAQAGPSVAVRSPEGEGYRLAVIGAWLGAVSPALAEQRRPDALKMLGTIEEGRGKQMARAGMAWYDGLLAFARGDRAGIKLSRRNAAVSGWYQAGLVDRSLEAFDLALAGDRKSAGRKLADLEQYCLDNENCNSWVPPSSIQRLAAAQWLQEAGALEDAVRLLRWPDAPRYGDGCSECDVVEGPTFVARARLELARGDSARAREYYRQFLQRYDQPMPSQVHLVREADAALGGLERD